MNNQLTSTADYQQKALARLAEVWALSPEVRFDQLMAHLGFLDEAYQDHGLGDIEDDQLLEVLRRHPAELLNHGDAAFAAGHPVTHQRVDR